MCVKKKYLETREHKLQRCGTAYGIFMAIIIVLGSLPVLISSHWDFLIVALILLTWFMVELMKVD